eukprot:4831748-Alexandrium_andersonii.AAC.1
MPLLHKPKELARKGAKEDTKTPVELSGHQQDVRHNLGTASFDSTWRAPHELPDVCPRRLLSTRPERRQGNDLTMAHRTLRAC